MTSLQQTLQLWGSKYYELNLTLFTNSNDEYDDLSSCIVGSLHGMRFYLSNIFNFHKRIPFNFAIYFLSHKRIKSEGILHVQIEP